MSESTSQPDPIPTPASMEPAGSTPAIAPDSAPAIMPAPERVTLNARLRSAGRALLFNPFTLLFGPIFQKEVQVTGRRRATYWVRALYTLALVAILALVFISFLDEITSSSGARRLQRLQHIAPVMATGLLVCQGILLHFIAPLLTGGVISQEKTGRTLSALLTTPMSAAEIIFGKLTSRVVLLLILVLVSTPMILAVRIYGGLEARYVVGCMAITLSSTLLIASLGVLFSIWHKRATTASVFAMFAWAIINFAPVATLAAIAIKLNSPAPPVAMFFISAPISFIAILAEMHGSPAPTGANELIWGINTTFNLVLTAATLALATVIMRRYLKREGEGGVVQETVPKGTDPEASSTVRSVGDYPVLWREVRQNALGSRLYTWILGAIILLAMGWIYIEFGLADEVSHYPIVMIGALLLLVQATVCSVHAITGEREAQTWEVLITTPMSPLEIMLGKFLGSLRRLWLTAALLLLHFLIVGMSGMFHPMAIVHIALALTGACVMLTGTGLLFSTLVRRTTTAAVLNLGMAVLLWIGGPIFVFAILDGLFDFWRYDWFEGVQTAVTAINPMPMTVIALTEGFEHARSLRYAEYPIGSDRMSLGTFTATTFMVFIAMVGAGLGAIVGAVVLFPLVGNRTS